MSSLHENNLGGRFSESAAVSSGTRDSTSNHHTN